MGRPVTAPVVPPGEASSAVPIGLVVNGRAVTVRVDPMRRLSDVLRDDLGLTGTKVGCEAGDCGACTVRMGDRQAVACLVPAAQAAGAQIRTVEGLAAPDGAPSDLQAAFLAHGAAQCGICTPGMLMAAQAYIDAGGDGEEDSIREAIAGNLCRCTGYTKIIEAIALTAERRSVA